MMRLEGFQGIVTVPDHDNELNIGGQPILFIG